MAQDLGPSMKDAMYDFSVYSRSFRRIFNLDSCIAGSVNKGRLFDQPGHIDVVLAFKTVADRCCKLSRMLLELDKTVSKVWLALLVYSVAKVWLELIVKVWLECC